MSSNAGTPASAEPIKLTAPSGGVTRGLTYVIGDNFAVAMESKDAGLAFEALVAGPVWAAKDPTVSIEACAKVYLDESTGLITSDDSETEIGGFALRLASTSDDVVAIVLGQPAPEIPEGLTGITGATNTALGQSAATSLTSGTANTALGAAALASTTTGSANTAVGSAAGQNDVAGHSNVFVGKSAGYDIVDGDNNICLGRESSFGIGDTSNTLHAGSATSPIDEISVASTDSALGATWNRKLRFVNDINIRAKTSAPADAFLQGGSIVFWIDEATDKLMVRVKYSDNSFATGEVALTPDP
jgi:predicted RecA/RadA family phage recombinase